MKLFMTMVVLATCLFATSVATADTDEDIDVLKAEVAALKAEVAKLKAELAELKAKMGRSKADAEESAESDDSKGTGVTAPPRSGARDSEPVKGTHGKLVGTWAVDKDHAEKMLLATMKKSAAASWQQIPEEQRAAMLAQFEAAAKQQAQAMDWTLIAGKDGQWKSSRVEGGEPDHAVGTWKSDGKKVSFTVTAQDGQEMEDVEVFTGEFDGDAILLAPPSAPEGFVFRLTKSD